MTDKEILLSVALGAVFVALLFCLLAIIATRPAERLQIKTEVPTTETVCVEATEAYCKRYETKRILRE